MITLHSLSSWSWIPINLPLLARWASEHHFHQPKRLRSSRAAVSSLAKGSDFTLKRAIQQENSEHHHKVGWGLLYIPVTWDDSCGWFLCGWPGCNFFQNLPVCPSKTMSWPSNLPQGWIKKPYPHAIPAKLLIHHVFLKIQGAVADHITPMESSSWMLIKDWLLTAVKSSGNMGGVGPEPRSPNFWECPLLVVVFFWRWVDLTNRENGWDTNIGTVDVRVFWIPTTCFTL